MGIDCWVLLARRTYSRARKCGHWMVCSLEAIRSGSRRYVTCRHDDCAYLLTWIARIGVTASSIMMLLPPQSARRSVRLRCAGTLASISYLYSHLTAAWISSEPFSRGEEEDDAADNSDPAHLPWVQEFRERFLEIAQELQLLQTQATVAQLEGNVRGKWPAEEYTKLVQVESEMAWALGVVSVVHGCNHIMHYPDMKEAWLFFKRDGQRHQGGAPEAHRSRESQLCE